MNKQFFNNLLKKSGLFFLLLFLLTIKIQAAVQYNDTTVNAWCTSNLNALLNDVDGGYLNLFTEEEQKYFLSTECGGNNKITLVGKDEWENEIHYSSVTNRMMTSGDFYRFVINGSDSGNYASTGVSAFWTKTSSGADTNAYVIEANTGLTSTANVTDETNYDALPAFYLDPSEACMSHEGTTTSPATLSSGYCVLGRPSLSSSTGEVPFIYNNDDVISYHVELYDPHDRNLNVMHIFNHEDDSCDRTIDYQIDTSSIVGWQTIYDRMSGMPLPPFEMNVSNLCEGVYNAATFVTYSDEGEVIHDDIGINFVVDKTPPICGFWDGEDDWKVMPSGTEFVLAGSTDNAGGSGLKGNIDGGACVTGPLSGDNCAVVIEDNAGNETICVSPPNKVDIFAPNLQVTAPMPGWQGDKQNIMVTAEDEQTALARIAYSWNINTLGSDCSGGTEINTGDDLRTSIIGGENVLYVCAVDVAGNVANYSNTYLYIPPEIINPQLDQNVSAENLYWNIQAVSKTQSYIEIKGFFPKTAGSYNYALELIIPTINKSYIQAIRTSPFAETHFKIIIPTSDFEASKDNHTFSGPQKLKITDLEQMEAKTIDYNLNFFFPIYQSNHRKNNNYFILSSDNRLNEFKN